MCQIHSAIACTTVATSARRSRRHGPPINPFCTAFPNCLRQTGGRAQRKAPIGRAMASSGAATTMSGGKTKLKGLG